MREIKFRQFRKDVYDKRKSPTGGVDCFYDELWHYWGYVGGVFVSPIHGLPSDQFTGLKDKNGKEIYEGDIIEYIPFLSSGIAYRTEPERTIVVFKETAKFCGFYPFGLFNALLPHDVVVIGNIYDNPKLLKKLKKE